ncbi:hypothetical protein Micbo1qcDRAFT_166523 [Microdochium bolleyi]|uniref:Uncharacterized protein n=1 Tax=Microdochium bolleyi TaxID=196109 RepID=A0A136IU89_9PEZI|nr:hypothetical protein Micbo1qcDRAFT_166523 [Microdochium bolleyi]
MTKWTPPPPFVPSRACHLSCASLLAPSPSRRSSQRGTHRDPQFGGQARHNPVAATQSNSPVLTSPSLHIPPFSPENKAVPLRYIFLRGPGSSLH